MVAEGGLGLEIAWNGKEVTGVTIRSTRPLYLSRVLEGKLAAQAMAMVPLLFSVCGRAQTVAAVRALEAARGIYLTGTISRLREMVVAAECVREHLMRILLDLPPLLGQPALQEPLLRVQRRFEEVRGLLASRPAWWEEQGGARDDLDPWRVLAVDLAGVLASEVLGMGPARFLALTTLEALTVWRAAGRGAAAALLAAIWDQPLGRSDVTPMALPEAVTLGRRIAAALDADDAFAAVPSLDGAPAETGALAREAEHPLVAAALAERGNTVGVRLVARLMDLARLSQRLLELAQGGGGASWMRAVGVRPGAGIAAVETARGVLIHAITLDGDRIARWRIVAPTEWNFHPDGAFTRGLIGWEAQDEDAVKRAAKLLAHALDPCVAFEVSVNHA